MSKLVYCVIEEIKKFIEENRIKFIKIKNAIDREGKLKSQYKCEKWMTTELYFRFRDIFPLVEPEPGKFDIFIKKNNEESLWIEAKERFNGGDNKDYAKDNSLIEAISEFIIDDECKELLFFSTYDESIDKININENYLAEKLYKKLPEKIYKKLPEKIYKEIENSEKRNSPKIKPRKEGENKVKIEITIEGEGEGENKVIEITIEITKEGENKVILKIIKEEKEENKIEILSNGKKLSFVILKLYIYIFISSRNSNFKVNYFRGCLKNSKVLI